MHLTSILCAVLVLNINFLFSSLGEVDTRFSFCAIASLKLLVSPDTYYILLYIVIIICLLIGLEPTANFGNQCNLQIS